MNFIDTTVDSAAEFTAPRAERPSDAQVVIRVFAGLRSVWMLTNEQLNALAGLPVSPRFDPQALLDMGPSERALVLNRMVSVLDVASLVRDRFGASELSWLHQRNGSTDLKNKRPIEVMVEEGGAALIFHHLTVKESEESKNVVVSTTPGAA